MDLHLYLSTCRGEGGILLPTLSFLFPCSKSLLKNNPSNIDSSYRFIEKGGEMPMAGQKYEWFKNAGKSMTNLTKGLLKDMMPTTINTATYSRDALKDARRFATEFNSIARSQDASLKRSAPMKKAKAAFNDALADLRSGKFGFDRANDDMFDDWDHDLADNFDMGTWDEEESEYSDGEITLKTSEAVAQSVIRASSAQLEGMEAMTQVIVGSTLKGQEASTNQVISAITYTGNMLNRNIIGINNSLGVINQNLVSMINFQNEVIAPVQRQLSDYIEESSSMFKDLGNIIENFEKYQLGASRAKGSHEFDVSSGFDPKSYKKYVKKNFKNNFLVSLIETLSEIDKYDSTPLAGKLIKMGMSAIIPSSTKDTLKDFDKNISTYMQELLDRVGDMSDSTDLLKSMIGDIFGTNRKTISNPRMGSYHMGNMMWNGMAQKALTEVIPEYLSSMEASLLTLVKHFNAKDSVDRRYMDYRAGQFKSKSDLIKDFKSDRDSKLQFELMEPLTALTKYLQSTGLSPKEQKNIVSSFNSIINDRINNYDSVQKSRQRMGDTLAPLSDAQFKDVLVGVENGLRSFSDYMNELYADIESTQHVYRHLGNNRGKELWSKDMKIDAFGLALDSPSRTPPSIIIQNILSESGRSDMSSASDKDLQRKVLKAQQEGKRLDEIREIVIKYDNQNRIKAKGSDILKRFFGESRSRAAAAANAKINELDTFLAQKVYGINRNREARTQSSNSQNQSSSNGSDGGDSPPPPQPHRNRGPRPVLTPIAASSGATRRNGINAGSQFERSSGRGSRSKYNRRNLRLTQIENEVIVPSADRLMNETAADAENRDIVLTAELRNQAEAEPDDTIEGSIAEMNNTTRTGFLTILNSFQNLNRGIFGKEGFIKKFFESTAFKNTIGKLQDYLIGEDHGVFKEQWKTIKTGAKNFGGKVKGHLLDAYDFVFGNTMKYTMGEDYKEKELYQKYFSKIDFKAKSEAKRGTTPDITPVNAIDQYSEAVIEAGEEFREQAEETAENLFGDAEEPPEKKKSTFLGKFLKAAPKGIAAAALGAGAVALSGGSMGVIGSLFLPTSIVGGAIAGFGTMMLSQTEAFKSLMFGKENDNGERQGGIITKKMGETFKKSLPVIVGGATLGALKHVITGGNGIFSHGPLGVITSTLLPGGVLGGALLGLGVGILKNSDTIKDKLFGPKDDDGKRSNGFISSAYNKLSAGIKKTMPKLKAGAAGAGVGVLSAVTLGNMGAIPAAFTLGGPVGLGIAGFSLGIASSTKKFNEMVFGSEELDENGNPTGNRNKDGLLGRMRNLLMVHVFEPIGDKFDEAFQNTRDWVKEAIEFPFRKAVGPIIDGLTGVKDNIVEAATEAFSKVGNGIVSIFQTSFEKLFSPLTKLASFMGKSVANLFSIGTKVALSPLSAGAKLLELATMGKRRKGYIDFYKDYFGQLPGMLAGKWELEKETGQKGGLFHRTADIFSAIFDPDNELKSTAREGYNEQMKREGKDTLSWREVPTEQRELKRQKKDRKNEIKRWRKIDKLRQGYSKEWGGREFQLREAEEKDIIRRFGKLGIDLEDSEDIMNLVYHRNEWKKDRLNNKPSDIVDSRTDQEKEADVAQIASAEYLKYIKDVFEDLAWQREHPDWDTKTSKEQRRAAKHLQKIAKENGYDLNYGAMDLTEEELISTADMTNEEWNEYRSSSYYESGNFKDWLKVRNRNKQGPKPVDKSGSDNQVKGSGEGGNNTDPIRALNNTLQDLTETQNAALEMSTGGARSAEQIKDKSRRGIRGWMNQFNISESEDAENRKNGLTALFDKFKFWKKKKDRITREEEEQEAITSNATTGDNDAATGEIEDQVYVDNNGEVKEKKKGIFSTLFGLVGKIFSPIGSALSWLRGKSKGSFLGTALKTWGIGSLLIGIINAFSPGFSDKLMDKAESVGDEIPRLTEQYIVPSLGKIIDGASEHVAGAIDWAGENLPGIITPAIEGLSTIVTDYGPKFIEKSADVMITLIPSMTQAFIKVVPALAQSLVTGIYDATLGSFINGRKSKVVSEDQIATERYDDVTGKVIARSDANGNKLNYNPETGVLERTGDRVAVAGADGEQHTVKNAGAAHAIGNFFKATTIDMIKHGSKSAGGRLFNAAGTVLGGTAGGMAGHIVPGAGTVIGARYGAKGGKKLAGLYTKTFEAVGDAATRNADEIFTSAAGNLVNVTAKSTKTFAEEMSLNVAESYLDGVAKNMEHLASNKTVMKWIGTVGKKIRNGTGLFAKIGQWCIRMFNTMKGALKTVGNKLGSYVDNIARKIGVSATKIVPFVQVAFTAWDGVTGLFEASNLFHTNNPDWIMRIISSLLKMLLGTLPGVGLDILFEIGSSLLQRDLKQELCTYIYGLIAGEEKKRKLEASQEQMAIETQIYNQLTNSNLTEDAYNDLKNKSVWDKAVDGITSIWDTKKRERLAAEKDAMQKAEQAAKAQVGNSTSETKVTRGGGRYTGGTYGNTTVVNIYNDNGTVNRDLGKGPAIGYGNFSQGDSRWANMRIGTMPNGKPATMANGGCGPTAFAMAVNDLMGYGPVTPAAVGQFAARNGYISSGGANAGLFTEGAARMGIGSTPIQNSRQAVASIASGNPVILSGRSSGGSDPYTKAGHIVVAEGMDRSGRVNVKDPADGRTKKYGINSLLRKTETGFALSRGFGYGPYMNTGVLGFSAGGDKYATPDGFMSLLAGDKSLKKMAGTYNGYPESDMRKSFAMMEPDEITRLVHLMTRYNTSFPIGEAAKNTGVTQSMLSNVLESMAMGHRDVRTYNFGMYGSKRINLNARQRIDAYDALDMFNLRYTRGIDFYPSKTNSQLVKAMFFDESYSPIFAKYWLATWLPVNDLRYVKRWCECLDYMNTSGLNYKDEMVPGGLKISTVTTKLRELGLSDSKNSQAKGCNELAKKVEEKFSKRIAKETNAVATPTSTQNGAALDPNTLYSAILSSLETHKISDYTTYDINGYPMYDIDDENWANLVYGGKALSEVSPKVSSELMVMSSLLSAFTGKAFTPKLMIESVLPYVGLQNKKGVQMPYYTNGQVSDKLKAEQFKFENTNATALKNFFNLDFIRDENGNSIVPTRWSYQGNEDSAIEALKNSLINNVPLYFKTGRFDGSIFGGTGTAADRNKDENAVAGILQYYDPSSDRLQYLGSNKGNPLYTYGANIFTRFLLEHLSDGGIQFRKSDGSVPKFYSSPGQVGILADGLDAPNVEGEFTGPFAMLSKLLSYIASGIEGVFTGFLEGTGFSSAIGNAANKISNLFGGQNVWNVEESASKLGITGGGTSSQNEPQIWRFLRQKGLSEIATASIMANLFEESRLQTNNLQNNYNNSLGMTDASYTAAVDNGRFTRNDFAGKGHKHGGYGLAQWTHYARKQGLYDLAKSRNVSISDLPMQLDYLWYELQNGGYPGKMNSFSNVAEATAYFMNKFERPKNTNPSKRIQTAYAYLNKYSGLGMGPGPLGYGFTDDANTLMRTMGGLMYSKMNGGTWQEGMDKVGDLTAGINTFWDVGSTGDGSWDPNFSGSSALVSDYVANVPPGTANSYQKALVNKMNSIYGKIRYSTDAGVPQNPDQGVASCASTVGWAYRKVLDLKNMSAGAGYQAADKRFTTIYQKTAGGQRPDLSKLQLGDIIYEDWRAPYKYDQPFNSTVKWNGNTPYYSMSHAEMFAGNGKALSHGGPGNGPIAVNLDADRQKGIMLVRRYTPFVEQARKEAQKASSVVTADPNSYKLTITDWYKDPNKLNPAARLGTGPAHYDRIETGYKALRSAKTTPYDDHVYYGTGPSTEYRLHEAVRNGNTEQKLDAILGVITEWYGADKNRPTGGPVSINTTTNNTVVSANGKTQAKHTKTKPESPSSDRLRNLYDSIAKVSC